MSETLRTDEPAPMPTRERQRIETRNLILRVALGEIGEAGLAQARIGHIARKAGVTRPTIYAHFPRKEDFLRALETYAEERVLAELRSRIQESEGPDLIHRMVDVIFDLLEVGNPVLRRETFARIIREPPDGNWTQRALFGFVSELLEAAQARGELRSTIPPEEFIPLVVKAIFGFLVVESEPANERRRASHRMLDLLIAGAATTEGKSQ